MHSNVQQLGAGTISPEIVKVAQLIILNLKCTCQLPPMPVKYMWDIDK